MLNAILPSYMQIVKQCARPEDGSRKAHHDSTDLTGVLVALVTPFTADGREIDGALLEAHVDRLIREGVHGLVPGAAPVSSPP